MGLPKYLQLFPKATSTQLLFEKSPTYLRHPNSAQEMHTVMRDDISDVIVVIWRQIYIKPGSREANSYQRYQLSCF